ncbi:MAG: tRNA preQ1(34) S-adenosylmethionine ribosyltransferase-isomerase QueA [Candidatus Omnitrophota bacterium]
MKLSDFDYYLPKDLIAQYPLKERDLSRMMLLERNKRGISHKHFRDVVAYFKKGDTVVLNDSRVIPARIICKKETGGKAEIFLLKRVKKNIYEALTKPAARLMPGKRLFSKEGDLLAEVLENREVGKLIRFADVVNIEKYLKSAGQIPLPPYIKREPEEDDKERYQTIYAKNDGSVASPTAGLHFTKETFKKLKKKGVNFVYVTLHVGYSTFTPVKVEDITKHKMHKEDYLLPEKARDLIEKTKRKMGRVIAVGTTTARVLEANSERIMSGNKIGKEIMSATDLFIYPPYKFKMVDALLTNFHLPGSTLLMLVSAFAGREFTLKAYKEAVKENYRFYSYGDCMLII